MFKIQGHHRPRAFSFSAPWLLAVVAALTMGTISACSEDSPVSEPETFSDAQLLQAGWLFFEQGLYDSALGRFGDLASARPGHAEAAAGLGWSLFRTGRVVEALVAFEVGMPNGSSRTDLQSGRAAAAIAMGGSRAADAEVAARAVLLADPTFVFEHDTSVDHVAVRRILVLALVAQGEFEMALEEGNFFLEHSLDAQDSASWVVQGLRFESYAAAAVAHLEAALQL